MADYKDYYKGTGFEYGKDFPQPIPGNAGRAAREIKSEYISVPPKRQTPLVVPTIAAEVSISPEEICIQDEIPGLGYVCVYTRGGDGTTIHTTMGHVLKFYPGYETKILVKRMN